MIILTSPHPGFSGERIKVADWDAARTMVKRWPNVAFLGTSPEGEQRTFRAEPTVILVVHEEVVVEEG